MANTFRYTGQRVNLTNIGTAVGSGTLCRRNGFIGIPLTNAIAGASVSFALQGVWAMTFSAYGGLGAGPMPAVGTILYWDVANSVLSNGCGVNDYAAVKVVEAISTTDGSFFGLLLPPGRPKTSDQS